MCQRSMPLCLSSGARRGLRGANEVQAWRGAAWRGLGWGAWRGQMRDDPGQDRQARTHATTQPPQMARRNTAHSHGSWQRVHPPEHREGHAVVQPHHQEQGAVQRPHHGQAVRPPRQLVGQHKIGQHAAQDQGQAGAVQDTCVATAGALGRRLQLAPGELPAPGVAAGGCNGRLGGAACVAAGCCSWPAMRPASGKLFPRNSCRSGPQVQGAVAVPPPGA
jgi:hypothetical protein